MDLSVAATVPFRLARSKRGAMRWAPARAIQYSAESPRMAPKAPDSTTSPRLSEPAAARVEAASRVVSPGNTGQTASPNTSRKTSEV